MIKWQDPALESWSKTGTDKDGERVWELTYKRDTENEIIWLYNYKISFETLVSTLNYKTMMEEFAQKAKAHVEKIQAVIKDCQKEIDGGLDE